MKLIPVLSSALVMSSLTIFAASAQETDIGAELYTSYCAACHGATGMGDGDMANVVNIPSPNLTLLAKNNDGVFPMLQVLQVIDGRTGVRAHGGVMPLWGQVFSDDVGESAGPYGSVLEVRGRLLSLATYLQSIQQ